MHGRIERFDNNARPLKVLLLLTSLHGGGAERVAVHLLNRMDPSRYDMQMGLLRGAGPSFAQADHSRIILAANGDRQFNFDGPNSAQYAPGKLAATIVRAPMAFRKMIHDTRPDVVMSFLKGTNMLVWLALAGMGENRPKWIAREGNNVLAVVEEETGSRVIANRSLALTRKAYARADAVLANSTDMAAGLVEDLRLDPAQMRMINNPIDLATIERSAQEPIKGAPDRPFILTAGRLEYQKGQEVLIRAYAKSELWRSHALVILGKGSRLGMLHRLAQELGVGEHVRFIGFVANPYAWMARAALFVLPSRWEGFPTVAAEAMASGAPLLLTDCRFGPRDVIVPGRSGELVPVDDANALAAAMTALIASPERRAQLIAAGRKRVRNFAIEPMIDRYGRLFTEMALKPATVQQAVPRLVTSTG